MKIVVERREEKRNKFQPERWSDASMLKLTAEKHIGLELIFLYLDSRLINVDFVVVDVQQEDSVAWVWSKRVLAEDVVTW